jgi:hypothetical protein
MNTIQESVIVEPYWTADGNTKVSEPFEGMIAFFDVDDGYAREPKIFRDNEWVSYKKTLNMAVD